jgi:hypothetical protein
VEDELLTNRYDELGPAWTVLSLGLQSRSPIECRRRWLIISGALEELSPENYKLIYEEGYERHNGRLIKVPKERIVAGPFARLAAAVEPVRFRSERRRGGWQQSEYMAVQEGLEQYGPRWDFIAKRMQYRTGRQCRNMMQRRYIGWNANLIEKSRDKLVKEPKC